MHQNSATILEESALRLMAAIPDKDKTFRIALLEGSKLVSAERGSIFLNTSEKGVFLKRVFSTVPKDQQLQPRKNGNTFLVYKSGKPLFIENDELEKIHPEAKDVTSVAFIPIKDGKQTIGVMTLQNFTRRLEMLDRQTLTLFGTLTGLALANIQLYEQKERAVKLRDRFFSIISHELRTPLTSIKAHAQLTAHKMKVGKPASKKSLDIILQQATRLEDMITSVFTANQFISGTLFYDFEQFSFSDFIVNLHKALREVYPQKVLLEMTTDSELIVHADEQKMYKLVTNILRNASKYSPTDATIRIVVEEDYPCVLISVIDQGEGVASDKLDTLFDKYVQGDNRRDGLGIGLYIVRKVAEDHGGHVVFNSEKGVGTTVTVAIPLQDLYVED